MDQTTLPALNNLPLLSQLSPAETMIILYGVDAPFTELIKVTFMDLVLKNVFAVVGIRRQPSSHDPVHIYKYIVKGEAYPGYRPLHHEEIYMDLFEDKILLRNMIKAGYEGITSSGLYRSRIIKNRMLHPYFRQNILQRLKGRFTLTEEGARFREQVETEYREAVAQIKMQVNDPSQAHVHQALQRVGGNIFLMNDLDLEFLPQFDLDLMIEIEKSRAVFTDIINTATVWQTPG